MELVLKGDLQKYFMSLVKRDAQVARALASQWLEEIEATPMHAYLLSEVTATALLTARFKRDPEGTLAALAQLPPRSSPKPRRGGPKKARRTAAKSAMGRKRPRYTTAQVSKLKDQILRFIGANPGANRKQINNSVKIPSLALYHRLMGELRDEKMITAKGDRSKTTYNLRKRPGRKSR
jgi:hypothetical protein